MKSINGKVNTLTIDNLVAKTYLVSKTMNEYLESLLNILAGSWFSRAWIVQEAALSKRPLVVQGSEVFDLRILHLIQLAASMVAANDFPLHRSPFLLSPGATIMGTIGVLRQHVLIQENREARFTFLDILMQLCLANCTDPRDHVYAFLAFQDPSLPQIQPEYSLAPSAVFTTVSAWLANTSGSLAILGSVRGAYPPDIMPSWAIDWRLRYESTQGQRLDSVEDGKTFNASKARLHKMSASPAGILPVRGKLVDRISYVSSHSYHHNPSDLGARDYIPLTLKLHEMHQLLIDDGLIPIQYESSMQSLKRLLRVLLAHKSSPTSSNQEQENELGKMLLVYENFAFFWENSDKSYEYPEYGLKVDEVRHSLSAAAAKCYSKRIIAGSTSFRDGSSRRLGLAPKNACEGDVICILHGSKVPCILRQQESHYQVIGQCYFEDWMYGELVDWEEDNTDLFELV